MNNNKKYNVGESSNDTTFLPAFLKISQLVPKLKMRQYNHLCSLGCLFIFMNKSRIICTVIHTKVISKGSTSHCSLVGEYMYYYTETGCAQLKKTDTDTNSVDSEHFFLYCQSQSSIITNFSPPVLLLT